MPPARVKQLPTGAWKAQQASGTSKASSRSEECTAKPAVDGVPLGQMGDGGGQEAAVGCRIAKQRQRPRAASLDYAQSCGEQVEEVRTLERTRSCGQVALNLANLQSFSWLQLATKSALARSPGQSSPCPTANSARRRTPGQRAFAQNPQTRKDSLLGSRRGGGAGCEKKPSLAREGLQSRRALQAATGFVRGLGAFFYSATSGLDT